MSPRFNLAVQVASQRPIPERRRLRRLVAAALAVQGAADGAQILLRFVDEEEGRTLNRDFRHKDYATNVLTFPYDESQVARADIMLCTAVVEREAAEQGKSLNHHYAHLVVHGVLHACGHEHEDETEAEAMEALERRVLARFRISDPYEVVQAG